MVGEVRLTRLAGAEDAARLLVVGPSLGTSVSLLWRSCVARLGDGFEVIGWDLPGHGNGYRTTEPFTVQDIAAALETQTRDLAGGRSTGYAGVSFGGAVGLELATRDDSVFEQVVCIAAAPTIGEPQMWRERAALVRKAGTAAVVEGASRRWFAPGFAEREPDTAGALFTALTEVDDESYALACEALAVFHAGEPVRPVHAVAGEHDVVVTPEAMGQVKATTFRVLETSGHLPPVESPAAVAQVLLEELAG